MQKGWSRTLLCLACLWLPGGAMIGMGPTAVGADQSRSPSILDRAQRESDPELSELIRVALANLKNLSEKETFEVVRKITQSYAQIRLLDHQIEQLGRKIETIGGPAELRYELVLAKAELEAKRTTEMASLRETMGVIPRFPFDKQPLTTLNAWVSLDIVDQRVVVLDVLKPYSEYWAMLRHNVAGFLSEEGTLDHVRALLKDRKNLPIRIDIYYKPETHAASEKLRSTMVSLVREMNAGMDAEVRLERSLWVGKGESPFYLRDGKIYTFYPEPVRRPDGGPDLLPSGPLDPKDLEQHILWRLTKPKNVPLTFRIEYDEAGSQLAKQVADAVQATAKRVGLADLVNVATTLIEPLSEDPFLGRWQALGKNLIQTIDIQSGGMCQATMGGATQAIKAGATVRGTWLWMGNEILVDINDRVGRPPYVYLVGLNTEGNLVIQRGEIYPQGNFDSAGPPQMVFGKVQ